MKITLPALTALAVAAALVSAPHRADAATPLATFAKMKKAVLAQAKPLTKLEVHVGKVADGSIGSWVVLDGDLIPVGPDGTIHSHKDGKDITVKMSSSADLSSLTPDQRAMVEKAMKDAMNGSGGNGVTTQYIVNGKEVDGKSVHDLLEKAGVDISFDIDLDAADYRSIAFGTDHNHLVLSPKRTESQRYVITLDPKTNLPKTVVAQRNEHGKWITAGHSDVTLR